MKALFGFKLVPHVVKPNLVIAAETAGVRVLEGGLFRGHNVQALYPRYALVGAQIHCR